MNHLIGVYRIKIKIIHDFPIFLPINPSIIRLPIGITSKMRCSPKENKPTRLPVNKEAMFPKGEQAHPTTKPSSQQGSDVPQRGTSPSHNKAFRSTRKRCFPKGNEPEPTPRQACFIVYCTFRPLEVRRHLVNALPKGAVNLVPLRTSTSGSVSEVQHTIKPLLYVLQCIRLRNLRNLHKLKHSNNRIAHNSHNNHFHKAASSYHIRNISCHHSVQI